MGNEKTRMGQFNPNYFVSSKGHIRDRIIINEHPSIPKQGQFISLNGYAFLAKAGIPIDIPRPVRKMLDTLIETQTYYGEDGKEYSRDIKRITYTLVQEGVNLEPEPEAASPVPASPVVGGALGLIQSAQNGA